MCLLKRSTVDTNCKHDECKNYYTLNKQKCMYSIGQVIPSSNMQPVSINTIQPQIQFSSILPQKPTIIAVPQQQINAKRPAATILESNIGEQESLFLNKKKIKPEDENKNEDSNQSSIKNDGQNNFNNLSDLNLFTQQIINQASGDRMIPQTAYINGLSSNNGQICYTKQDNSNFQLGNSAIFIPVVQAPQANLNISNTYTPMISNQQSTFNSINRSQILPQIMKVKSLSDSSFINANSLNSQDAVSRNNVSSNSSTNTSTNTTSNENNSPNSAIEAFMNEFQSKMSGLLLTQNKMLFDLKEKNEIIQDTLACLINEMSSLKNTIKQTSQEKAGLINLNPLLINHIAGSSSETATTESLLSFLYGQNRDFQYQLVLKSNLTLPLYRERNFKFTLNLLDKDGKVFENTNRIPLTIAIYSSESIPKFIDANTAGNKILKGFIEKDLVNGTVTFEKIQIKEVTSHFRNGWVFFVVYPKISANINSNILVSKDSVVNSQKIRPFILEKVVVKAKKAKEEKEQSVEGDSDNAIFQDEETQIQTSK